MLCLLCTIVLFSGCAAFRIKVSEEDPEDAKSLTAGYDQKDLISWTDEIAQKLVQHPFPGPSVKGPVILVEMGIQNRTKSHLDTQALSENIRTKLMNSSNIKFVNARQRDNLLKEQGYQLQNCTEATRTKIARQLGAKYILSGSLVEISNKSGKQARLSKKLDVFYQLTVNLTNLETGIIDVTKQAERMRRARKPIIGW